MIPSQPDLPPLDDGHAALVALMTRGGVQEPFPLHCEPFGGASRDEPGCKWPVPSKPWYWRWWDEFVWSMGLVKRP